MSNKQPKKTRRAEQLPSTRVRGKEAKSAQAEAGSKPAVKLLSGGNPQFPKGDGDQVVQDYIAAMPGWKSDLGRRLDAIITRALPDVKKAVKWNSPMYGIADKGWFLGIHCFTK
jgi:hypothetical protein